MKLKSLTTKNLHGSLNLHLNLNDRLNLLIGINGCGKTSALKAIEWVLKRDLIQLGNAVFDEIAIKFSISDQDYTIVATQDDNMLYIQLYEDGHPKFDRIFLDLDYARLESDRRTPLHPSESERELWNFLQSLPGLTVISLDRSITAEIEDRVYSKRMVHGWVTDKTISPMEYVQKITSEQYANYRSSFIENDSELKSRIIMSSFEIPSNSDEDIAQQLRLSPENISSLERATVSFLRSLFPKDEVEQKAREFFQYIAKMERSDAQVPTVLNNLVRAQYERVDILTKAFNKYENANEQAFERLRRFLNSVNQFFSDSGKNLFFEQSSGQIFFRYMDEHSPRADVRPIKALSSGEQQILFLFTFIAFVAEDDTVFVVDEPELSLHPKWQHDFMDALLSLSPSRTQLILATHSPEIVGDYKSSCISLTERALR